MAGNGRHSSLGRDQSGRWAARLREVSEAALVVNSELDLHRLLQRVVDSARELVRARYAALGVARPDLTGLSEFVTSGLAPEEVLAIGPWPRGLGLLGALLREPKPLRVRNICEDPRSIGFPPHHPLMTSFLGVPVRLGDRILGNFYLTEKQGAKEFSQEDEDIIVLFASHAAVALDNARRFTEVGARLDQSLLRIQRAERRSRFLAELSGLLPIGPLVEQIPWETVAEGTTRLLGDGCAIYLVDPDDPDAVQTRVVQHRDPARAEADRRFIEESWHTIRSQVLGDGHSLFVARLQVPAIHRKGLDPELMRREKLSAAMVVPIRTKERIFGVFASLASMPVSFSQEDLTFAVVIADRLGVALENAELIGRLRAALQSRDEFVSIATHELKTPVTVLRGYAQALLARSGTCNESERRAMAAINQHSGRLADLVDKLLDVSRIRAGRLEMRPERFDLVELCREVVERFVLVANGGRLRLETDETALPGVWDRGHIDQVLTNLVSNALKYSPEGGDVVVQVRRKNGEALVSVSDQGIGIPTDQQDRIFEPFHRTANAQALRIEGAGLGLHISREIVERHGGCIWFESESGKGSTFYFTLPAARD